MRWTIAASSGDEPLGIGKIFSDPNALAKLAANPRTSKHLADPSFVQKVCKLACDYARRFPDRVSHSSKRCKRIPPSLRGMSMVISRLSVTDLIYSSALQDPRMIDALGVLMGIDIQAQTRPEGSSEGFPQQEARPPTPPPAASSSKKPEPEPEPAQDVEMEEVDEEEAKAKREAEASKKLGAEAYKKRDFDTAITHFEKAWDLYPKDITFLTNAGGNYSLLRPVSNSDFSSQPHISRKVITTKPSRLARKLSRKVAR